MRVIVPGGAPPGQVTGLDAALRELSGGNVLEAAPSGPFFARPRGSRVPLRSTFVAVLSPADRVVAAVLVAGWAVSFAAFWRWWFEPGHLAAWPGFVLNSLLLLYLTITPCYFLVAVLRLRRVNPALALPALRVAFVVTRAPSEHWSLARTTLRAMLAQNVPLPYDVWLCDEDPGDEVLRWCAANDVRVCSRRGEPGYHRATWPRRTRCKEGNLAYFYDHWGYRDYDVVAQLDCDHVPRPGYLTAMIRPFADPAIGYVAAPSVCDANAAGSWSARGRLHREAIWHGAVQLGHNGGLAPVCIGSHYAVRTRALRDIGGLGPELAEDFSTTFLMVSAGWHGAFAADARAHGDGPLTFADMVTQEFQWSRSLTTILYDLAPPHMKRMGRGLRLRFAYTLSFYPLLAVTTVAGVALPPIAAVTGLPWVDVNYLEFLAHTSVIWVWLLLLTALLRRRGLLRPPAAPILSWENALFGLTRWPFVVYGVLSATLSGGTGRRSVTFKVTPKMRSGLEPLPVRLVAPFALIAAGLSAGALVGEATTDAAGYVFLCLLGGATYAVVAVAVPVLHAVEAARAIGLPVPRAMRTSGPALLAGLAPVVVLAVALWRFPEYAIRVLGG